MCQHSHLIIAGSIGLRGQHRNEDPRGNLAWEQWFCLSARCYSNSIFTPLTKKMGLLIKPKKFHSCGWDLLEIIWSNPLFDRWGGRGPEGRDSETEVEALSEQSPGLLTTLYCLSIGFKSLDFNDACRVKSKWWACSSRLFSPDPNKTFYSSFCLFSTCLSATVYIPIFHTSIPLFVSFSLPKMTVLSFIIWKIPTYPAKPSSNVASSSKTSWILQGRTPPSLHTTQSSFYKHLFL